MSNRDDTIKIRPATRGDHEVLLAIAKSHKATRDFGHIMFSGEQAYQKGWIRVAIVADHVVGFTCVRHKMREPKTSLYYICVRPEARRMKVGQALLDDLTATSPHRCIELSCFKDNAEALAFYAKNGFEQKGEALKGKGWHLEKTW
jgi:ribosomal protein S18 acetylase RimI-like enzyme